MVVGGRHEDEPVDPPLAERERQLPLALAALVGARGDDEQARAPRAASSTPRMIPK